MKVEIEVGEAVPVPRGDERAVPSRLGLAAHLASYRQ